MPTVRGRAAVATAALTVATVLAAVGVLAQDKKAPEPADKVAPDAQAAEPQTSILVQCGPHITEPRLLETVKIGLDVAKCSVAGEPKAEVASLELYLAFDRLSNPNRPAPASARAGDLTLTRLPGNPPPWEFRLPDVEVLSELVVTYRKGGKRPALKPTDSGPLTYTSPGRYVLQAEKDDEPDRYEATLKRKDGNGEAPRVLSGAFQPGDNYFLITLPGFKGNLADLLKAMSDPRVGNKFDKVRLGPAVSLRLVEVDATARPGGAFDRNVYKPVVGEYPGRTPARAWMLFPLSEDEALKELARYRGYKTGTELSAAIRKDPLAGTAPDKLDAKFQRRWIELKPLPNDPKRYGCELVVEDARKVYDKYPRAYRLVVWEADVGKGQHMALFIDDKPKEADKEVKVAAAVEMQEVVEWPDGLKHLADAEKPATKEPNVKPSPKEGEGRKEKGQEGRPEQGGAPPKEEPRKPE